MITIVTQTKKTRKLSKQQSQAMDRMQAAIQKKNELFDIMTPNQRRVAIAKDALEHIRAGTYKMEKGAYVESKDFIDKSKVKQHIDNMGALHGQQVCSIMSKDPQCTVCARGAMFMSALMMFDRLKVRSLYPIDADIEYLADYIDEVGSVKNKKAFVNRANLKVNLDEGDIGSYERRFFTSRQVQLMESMFERGDFSYGADKPANMEDVHAAIRYGRTFGKTYHRMIEICENFIRNAGDFVVPAEFY